MFNFSFPIFLFFHVFFGIVFAAYAEEIIEKTPVEIQKLIDEKKCNVALQEIQKISENNFDKKSDILDVLTIQSALCDNRINSKNASYFLNVLNSIERNNPALIGFNAKEFNNLKDEIGLFLKTKNNPEENYNSNSYKEATKEESSFSMLPIITLVFIMLGIMVLFMQKEGLFGATKNKNKDSLKSFSDNDDLKEHLHDEINSFVVMIENKISKNNISGESNDRLVSILNKVYEIRKSIDTKTTAELKAAMKQIENLKVIAKVY